MNALGVRPSFATGFAQSPGESEYPELWRGLVAAYDPSLGMTGSRLIDWSGKGNHGTLTNVTWSAGKSGTATDHTADGSYIEIPNSDLFSFAGDKPFSIFIRFNMAANDGTSNINWLITKDGYSVPWKREWSFAVNSGVLSFSCIETDNADSIGRLGGSINTNQWYDAFATYDGSKSRTGIKIYLDGVRVDDTDDGSATYLGMTAGPRDVIIGNWFHAADKTQYDWNGLIGSARIYNRALPLNEIAFLSSNPTALVQLRRRVVMVNVGVGVGEDFFRTIEDGVGIVDSMSRAQDLSRTITDGVGTADTIGRTQVQLRTLAETLGLTDALWKAETRIFADAVGIADAVTKAQAFARTIADDIGLIDSESELMTYVRTLAETLGITDVMSKTVGFPRTISDDVGITDSVTRTAAFARVVAEAMGIEDVVTKTQVQLRTIADVMSLTDVMQPGQLIVFAEAMGMNDAMTHTKTQIRTIADSLGITDDLTRIATYVFTQSDDVGIGDAMIRVAVALRTISDDVGMTDTMSSISELVKAAWAFMLLKKSN